MFAYLTSLLTFFHTYLLPYLSTSSRIGPFRFHATGRRRWLNLAIVYCVYYMLVYILFVDACLVLLCLIKLFSTYPRDWLGRTSPKWPILYRVGRKTLTLSVSVSKECVDFIYVLLFIPTHIHTQVTRHLSIDFSSSSLERKTLGINVSGFSQARCSSCRPVNSIKARDICETDADNSYE